MGPEVGEAWGGMVAAHAITRSVRDSAALLDATAGADELSDLEQSDRPLPLSDKVTQRAFPSFGLSGDLEILLDRQIIKQRYNG